ncbi:hypothetical protein B0H16DRAFT_1465212 [Mycena metata]|uniref:Uncharacterized protein n=1 Tax=Mycena metata TaxID=1033252 RepID=A0AAD7IBR5_9AGAR|nr:hypothetical protein B0H16DRAFT_1465212 [Mycena metata]
MAARLILILNESSGDLRSAYAMDKSSKGESGISSRERAERKRSSLVEWKCRSVGPPLLNRKNIPSSDNSVPDTTAAILNFNPQFNFTSSEAPRTSPHFPTFGILAVYKVALHFDSDFNGCGFVLDSSRGLDGLEYSVALKTPTTQRWLPAQIPNGRSLRGSAACVSSTDDSKDDSSVSSRPHIRYTPRSDVRTARLIAVNIKSAKFKNWLASTCPRDTRWILNVQIKTLMQKEEK